MKKLIQLPPKSPWEIKPDVLIFSDLHLHERKEFSRVDPKTGLNTRLAEGLSILDQIIEIRDQHLELKWILNLGDIFELKDRIPNHILIEYQNRITKLTDEAYSHPYKTPYLTLMGNHDFNLPNYPSLKLFDNQALSPLISKPQAIDPWGFIPFQRNYDDFIKALVSLNNQTNPQLNIIFFHQELSGGEYESGKIVPGIFPSGLFKHDITYISGHLHKYQKVGPVVYIGGPYQKNFSDEGCRKYVWLLNSKTREMAPLELNYPKFVTIKADQLVSDEEIKGNYIRITGEVEIQDWTPARKKLIKDMAEKAGVLGVSLKVTVKRPHQSKIPENKIEDDDSIIRLYVDENFKEADIDQEKLFKIGVETFHQN